MARHGESDRGGGRACWTCEFTVDDNLSEQIRPRHWSPSGASCKPDESNPDLAPGPSVDNFLSKQQAVASD